MYICAGCGQSQDHEDSMCLDCLERRLMAALKYQREQKRKRELAEAMKRREQFFNARKNNIGDPHND